MSDKKANHKIDEVAGKVKETVGHAVGNRSLEAEGKSDQTKANLKQAGENVKDAVTSVTGSKKRDSERDAR